MCLCNTNMITMYTINKGYDNDLYNIFVLLILPMDNSNIVNRVIKLMDSLMCASNIVLRMKYNVRCLEYPNNLQ